MEAEYNKCLFCGKWIHKPKLFCDDVCERAYRVKELLSELHGVAIGNANNNV
jgi:predicted nucleic acid-binding Zn ribbon protein